MEEPGSFEIVDEDNSGQIARIPAKEVVRIQRVPATEMDLSGISLAKQDSFNEAQKNIRHVLQNFSKEESNIHHTHSTKEIHTTQNAQETVVTIDEMRESDGDEVQYTISKRTLFLSNGITAIITALLGAGVTLAIKFGECKK